MNCHTGETMPHTRAQESPNERFRSRTRNGIAFVVVGKSARATVWVEASINSSIRRLSMQRGAFTELLNFCVSKERCAALVASK